MDLAAGIRISIPPVADVARQPVAAHAADPVKQLCALAPSAVTTAAVSFACGAACTAAAAATRAAAGSERRRSTATTTLACSAAGVAVAAGWAAWTWARARRAFAAVGEVTNEAAAVGGVRLVEAHAVSVTHSHAGTHAPTLAHFYGSELGAAAAFDDAAYTGDCVVLDVADLVAGADRITVDGLRAAVSRASVDLASVSRLLLRTRPATAPPTAESLQAAAVLDVAAAQWLRAAAPQLVLIGTDAAALAAPEPRDGCTYRALAPADCRSSGPRVAALARLDFTRLGPRLAMGGGAVRGQLLTVFNPGAAWRHARGCVVHVFCDV